MKLKEIVLVLSLLAMFHHASSRPFFRRYYNYNRFMKKMSFSFEKAQVETLGAIFKRHVQRLRHTANKQVELVFLIDSSGTVGRMYFYQEVKFVKNLLADFTVDMNTTRVSVITFSSPHKIHRYVDYLTNPNEDQHKCRLLQEDLDDIPYTPGGTYTLGALKEAEKVLKSARRDAAKVIFLMTDGYSNGGDPRPVARRLKKQGVKIFTFGIRDGFRWELEDMASNPKNETCYILDSFEEFEALAKRALHTDLQSGSFIAQSVSKCGKLCNHGEKCCHDNATCTCGTYSGKYDCLCNPGFYGTGRGMTGCKPCPPGTYKNFTGQGGRSLCLACPDENQITPPGAHSERQCSCKRGFRTFGSKACTAARCPELSPPERGYFINSKCNNVFNAACGLRCNSGFELHGSSLRICQEDGNWSGQTAKCVLKTCPALSQPKNGLMICTTDDFSYSTVCRFTCNNGYQLVGSRKRTCLAIAFWTGIATRCREITCPPLSEIKDGLVTPPTCLSPEVIFGTVCQIACSSGYTLSGPRTKQCTPDGSWMATKSGPNKCLDETPPVLQCPDDIEIMADEEEDTTEVSWREPVPVDNSGLIPVLTTEPSVTSGSRFPVGVTTISYRAEDLNKNVAKCNFQIKVVDKTPPRVDRCPTPSKVVSKGKMTTVILEPPEFSDNSGNVVEFVSSKKSTDLYPVGTTSVTYTASDQANNNSTCVVDIVVIPHLCVSPQPPNNGNVSCQEGKLGVTCKISCKDGYAFMAQVADDYVCDYKTGNWTPQKFFPFPDCAEVKESNDILQPATVTLTGDISCQDHKSLLEIAENLEEEMKEKLDVLCKDNGLSCSLASVESVCEGEEDFNKMSNIASKKRMKRYSPSHERRKRSVPGLSRAYVNDSPQTRTKKSKISFDITLKGSLLKSKESKKELQAKFSKAFKGLLSSLQAKAKKMLSTKNKAGKIDHMSYDVEKVKYKCPDGSIFTDQACIYCPVGMFHDAGNGRCDKCIKGTYQEKEGQQLCNSCPEDTSTEKSQARDVKECKAICKPGTFSMTGLEPCETCQQGFFQADFSSRTCLPCVEGKTTKRRGCSSDEKCAELCPIGHASKTGLAPCLPCPTSAYQPKSGQTECLLCPAGGNTGVRGAASLSQCIIPPDSWEIQSDGATDTSIQFNLCDFENPCENGGVCKYTGGNLFTCECKEGFGGQTCQDVADLCKSQPCLNNGSCRLSDGKYKCDCLDGFSGDTCDINVDDCKQGLCNNGATCEDAVRSVICRCLPGFTGKFCESRIDECGIDPCLNGGTCTNKATGSSCACVPGYSGQRCEIDIDECRELPCLNDANCVDHPGHFSCECKLGYTGQSCETDIDDCLSSPCQHDGSCVDAINAFTCNCPEGFDGKICEEKLTSYYQLNFINPSIMDYGRLLIDRNFPNLTSVTASLWIKTTDEENQGTPFSYGVRGQPDTFTITDYRNLNVYINGEKKSILLPLNNGQWQHVAFTWNIEVGEWVVYSNGVQYDQGYNLSPKRAIPGNGVFIIGQEQDSVGGDFSAGETFVGSLSQLNIWDRVLAVDEIEKLRYSCEEFHGNVIAWPDVKASLTGDVTTSPSKFCEDCFPPESPQYGSADYTGVRPSDSVTYSCDQGYIEKGKVTSKCLISGVWENPPVVCKPISCPAPEPVENGRFQGNDFSLNKRVDFHCDKGFELNGPKGVVCTSYGDWDEDAPLCVAIMCKLPQLSESTILSNNATRVLPGTSITFSCTIGNKLQTTYNSVMCEEDGYFNKILPTCDPAKCSTPPTVSDAYVLNAKDEYVVGEIVKYRCLNGYDFDPFTDNAYIDSIYCLSSGIWQSDLPICNEIFCPEPPIVPRSVVTGDKRNFGSAVTYSCEPGYRASGRKVITCQGLGEWSRLVFRCRPIRCKDPPSVLFGRTVGDIFLFDSVLSYQCDQGYQRDGPEETRCLANGTWSHKDTSCRPVDCGQPPVIARGTVEAPNTVYPNKALYACDKGYELNGPSYLTCEANGQWSITSLTCDPVSCPAPETVRFASSSSSSTPLVFNTSVEYSCNTGYRLSGQAVRSCTEDGTWSPEAPVCKEVTCPRLVSPPHGSLDVDLHTYSHTALYLCDPDFKLVGVEVRTCLATGNWSDSIPECRRTKCEEPGSVDKAHIDYKDLSVGSIVRYSCEKGYDLVGKSVRRCELNLVLDGEDPSCMPVKCRKLDDLENGNIYLSNDESIYETRASFACHEGYSLVGIEEITCIFDGSWSGEMPRCQPVECPKAGSVIANGRMAGSSFEYKSVISYQCDEGYSLIGEQNRTCMSDGIWDSQVPSCQAIKCPRLHLQNGELSTFRRTFGIVVEFYCSERYHLNGPANRTCQADGQWSESDPTCLRIKCDDPGPLEHAKIIVKSETRLEYICNKGYRLEGSNFRDCIETENRWKHNTPQCVVHTTHCKDVSNDDFLNGEVIFRGASFRDVVEYKCNEGHHIKRSKWETSRTFKCSKSGKWKGIRNRKLVIPSGCEKRDCGHPGSIPHGKAVGRDYTYNTTVTFECEEGYQLGSVKSLRCLESGYWENANPVCLTVLCPQLYFKQGDVRIDGYTVKREAYYTCPDRYRINGSSVRVCENDGEWSGEEPTCVVVQCGQPEPVEHSTMSGWKEVYEMDDGVTYKCDAGFYLSGPDFRTCTALSTWTEKIPLCRNIECPELTILEHGYFQGHSSDFKEVTYGCNGGYELVGEKESTCLLNGTWSGGVRTCRRISCGDPPAIANAHIDSSESEGILFEDLAIYSCNTGYTPSGRDDIICQENGNWSSTLFSCTIITCPPISRDDVPNAIIRQDELVYGTVIDVSCETGYNLLGSSTMECTAQGTWNSYPECRIVTCPKLKSLEFGNVLVDLNHYGSTANFSCNDGYSLTGATAISCLASGNWSDGMPECQLVSCPEVFPSDIPNGIFDTSSFTHGSVIGFSCDEGYILDGARSITCTSDGVWDALYPRCSIVICDDLGTLEFGTVSYDSLEYESVSKFSCNIGYSLVGSDQISCLASGYWSDSPPVCQIISCSDITPVDIPNGKFDAVSFTFGSVVNFTCDEGFNLLGTDSIECFAEKVWSESYPVCEIVTCNELGELEHGSASIETLEYGSKAFFTCDTGYSLIGSNAITCMASGFWSNSMPVCQIKSCPQILDSDLLNGIINVDSFNYGSKANFICNEGYRLIGSSSLECLANEEWNYNYPVCNIVTCPKLGSLEFGFVNSDSDWYRSVASFSCNTGYSLNGPREITCMSTGDWSALVPRCEIVSCPQVKASDFPNGIIQATSFTFDSLIYFVCNEGYTLSGSQSIACTVDGSWNATYPTCNIVICPIIKELQYGTVSAKSWEYGNNASFSCDIGYSITGAEEILCLSSGVWSDEMPLCSIISCPIITSSDFQNGVFNATTFTYKSLVTFSCIEGYVLSGSSTIECNHNGLWSIRYPRCNIVTCPKLQSLTSGTVHVEVNEYGNAATFECYEGYNLKGPQSILCLSSGNWSDRVPSCEIVVCMQPPSIENGQFEPVGIPQTYGDKVLYSCHFGYTLLGSNTLLCAENGTYDILPPVCSRIGCPPPEKIEKGKSTSLNDTFISYSCITGYYSEGDTILECLLGGSWSSSPPTCLPILCPTPPKIKYGTVFGDVFSFGNHVTYECDAGYRLDGAAKRTCQDDGQWSEGDSTCYPISCGPPDGIANGYSSGDTYTFEEEIFYFCNNGFELTGASVLTCMSDGNWSNVLPTKCVRLSCGSPNPILNGRIDGSSYLFESEITYTCFQGYVIKGDNKRHCGASLTWSGLDPICERAPCSPPPLLKNGIIGGNSFLFEDTVNISCKTGYQLMGQSERVCQVDGDWSGEDPRCDEIFCSVPPMCDKCKLIFGLEAVNQFRVNSTVKYECENGYALNETNEKICQSSGQWSKNNVECYPIQCKPILEITNGVLNFSAPSDPYAYLSLVYFDCPHGFSLVGDPILDCLASGEWSSNLPLCKIDICPTRNINNGFTKLMSDISESDTILVIEREQGQYVAGDVIQIGCEPGYELNGPANSSCSFETIWSSTSTSCDPVPCPLPDIPNAIFSKSSPVFRDILSITCVEGLDLIGEDELQCGLKGAWKEAIPRCVLLTCGSPPIVKHSVLKGESFQIGDIAEYECKRGYELVGNSLITCGPSSQWVGSPPICNKIDCGPPDPIYYSILSFEETTFKSTASIICEAGFDLEGTEVIECGADRLWIYSPSSVCVPTDCGPPPFVEHSTVDVGDTIYMSVVIYTCDAGHFLEGTSSMQCEQDGKWGYDIPVCSPVDCSDPPTIDHGSPTANATVFYGVASYTCEIGYSLADQDETSLHCDEMGTWKGEVPSCNIVECGTPPSIENSVFSSLADVDTHFSSSVRYACAAGYTSKAETLLTCAASGLWEGEKHDCVKKDCSDYPTLANGEYSSEDDTLFGAQVFYSCLKGHVKTGPGVITCQENGQWSSINHLCAPVDCSYPPSLVNAVMNVQYTTYKSVVQYFCDKGFYMEGTSTSECFETGLWSVGGECKPVDCGNPPLIDFGNVSFTSITFKSDASYSCQSGYTISSLKSIQCGPLGFWEGFMPTCDIVNCSDPDIIQHGTVKYLGTSYLSRASYTCFLGYNLVGEDERFCQQNGTWSNATPSCAPRDCSKPPQINHGEVVTTGTPFKEIASYTCNFGYTIQGPSSTYCNRHGLWNQSSPVCNPVDCQKPTEIEHATIAYDSTTFGSSALYECEESFTFQGNSQIRCQANGLWSHHRQVGFCDMIDCMDPPGIENGDVEYTDSFFGAIAVYTCLPGFTPNTERVLTCAGSGYWEGEPLQCSSVICPNAPDILNGDAFETGVILTTGAQAKYKCHTGFSFLGSDVITCLSSGFWSEMPVCAPVRCPPPPNFPDAELIWSTGRNFKSHALYKCKRGYRMVKRDGSFAEEVASKCSETSTWDVDFSFHCEMTKCSSIPPTLDNGFAQVKGNQYLDVAQYTCDPGFKMEGDSFLTCAQDGEWSSLIPPSCNIVTCGSPPNVPDATYVGSRFDFGSTVIYRCNYGYKLLGSNSVQCLVTGRWSSANIRCEAIECSLLPDLLNGDSASKSAHPRSMGSTVSFSCHDGYRLAGSSSITCLESGQWDNAFPMCYKVIGVCQETIEVTHGKISPGKFPGDRVNVGCQQGYTATGNMTSVCRNDGTWTLPAGQCRRVSCGRPENPDRRNVYLIGRKYQYGDRVKYVCRYGFLPRHRPARITCLASGQWDERPACSAQCRIPCANNGICLGLNRCKCMPGWVGRWCHIANCIFPCLNGGKCVAPYKCSCERGYQGARCQKFQCADPCRNGGRCVGPNRCQCYGMFHGKQCEKRYNLRYRR